MHTNIHIQRKSSGVNRYVQWLHTNTLRSVLDWWDWLHLSCRKMQGHISSYYLILSPVTFAWMYIWQGKRWGSLSRYCRHSDSLRCQYKNTTVLAMLICIWPKVCIHTTLFVLNRNLAWCTVWCAWPIYPVSCGDQIIRSSDHIGIQQEHHLEVVTFPLLSGSKPPMRLKNRKQRKVMLMWTVHPSILC